MKDSFHDMIDYFESIMHTLDDSQRPQHDTLIDPPDPNGKQYHGWSTEELRWKVFLRRRANETYGPVRRHLTDEESDRFIEQVKQEFLAERKAAVSRATEKNSDDTSLTDS